MASSRSRTEQRPDSPVPSVFIVIRGGGRADPHLTDLAVEVGEYWRLLRLNGRLDALGLSHHGEQGELTAHRPVVVCPSELTRVGLATATGSALEEFPSDETLRAWLDDAMAATEHNPLPATEWKPVRATLGDELLEELLGISNQSLRRYANTTRPTPDDVATRLHFIALVNADLSGSYNPMGVRRWWQRSRSRLDGHSPLEALGPAFDPDSDTAATVRQLAAELVGAGSAT